jgi:hypothetical protein
MLREKHLSRWNSGQEYICFLNPDILFENFMYVVLTVPNQHFYTLLHLIPLKVASILLENFIAFYLLIDRAYIIGLLSIEPRAAAIKALS